MKSKSIAIFGIFVIVLGCSLKTYEVFEPVIIEGEIGWDIYNWEFEDEHLIYLTKITVELQDSVGKRFTHNRVIFVELTDPILQYNARQDKTYIKLHSTHPVRLKECIGIATFTGEILGSIKK